MYCTHFLKYLTTSPQTLPPAPLPASTVLFTMRASLIFLALAVLFATAQVRVLQGRSTHVHVTNTLELHTVHAHPQARHLTSVRGGGGSSGGSSDVKIELKNSDLYTGNSENKVENVEHADVNQKAKSGGIANVLIKNGDKEDVEIEADNVYAETGKAENKAEDIKGSTADVNQKDASDGIANVRIVNKKETRTRRP